MLNTCLENMTDFVHPAAHPTIKFIKDLAAGAVLVAAITAVVVALLSSYPNYYDYLIFFFAAPDAMRFLLLRRTDRMLTALCFQLHSGGNTQLHTGRLTFSVMIWNLFLAYMPLRLSTMLTRLSPAGSQPALSAPAPRQNPPENTQDFRLVALYPQFLLHPDRSVSPRRRSSQQPCPGMVRPGPDPVLCVERLFLGVLVHRGRSRSCWRQMLPYWADGSSFIR